MVVRHSLYGLCLASNSAIPGLPSRCDHLDPQVNIFLNELGGPVAKTDSAPPKFSYTSSELHVNGLPVLRAGELGDSYFGLFYADGSRFAVKRDGSEVWANGPAEFATEDLATYLVGPVMGFVLRLHGILPLHACAVAVGNQAIALVGDPGAGKSTTAAAFAQLGYAVLSEDVAALAEVSGHFVAQPGYPRVNLWPESAELLFGSVDTLPLITPTWGKQFLSLDGDKHRFQSDPLPLSAIFILSERLSAAVAPKIEAVSAASAMTALLTNTYVNYLLDAAMRRKEFVQLGHLLANTRVFRVWPSDDPSRVYELCNAIVAEVQGGAACVLRP